MTRLINLLQIGLAVLGGIALVGVLGVITADVVLRAFGMPMRGTYELVGWLSATALGAALGHTQAHKGHVVITLVLDVMPVGVRRLLEALTSLIAVALVAAVAYYLIGFGTQMQAAGSLSATLNAPIHPWVYWLALGMGVFALVLAADCVEAMRKLFHADARRTQREEGRP